MPTPTKFTSNRKTRILRVLRAGGSHAEAARAAGVSGAALCRWIEAGRTSRVPDGRWATFYREVREAEGSPPELQLLKDRFEAAMASGESALALLDRLEREEVPETPLMVTVTTAKGDPWPTLTHPESG